MVSSIVYADEWNGGKTNDGNGKPGNWNGGKTNDGNGKPGNWNDGNGNSGNWNGGKASDGNVGRGNGNDGRGKGNFGNGNERNAVDKVGNDLRSTSFANNKTSVIQHMVSTPVVQAPVVVLLVTYSAEAAPSASGTWWNVMESYVEGLVRKFFFLSGSMGEKIKRKDVLRNRKRREIYYFVVDNPFSHFRRITRTVRVGPNQCSWHLRILEKMGFIKSEHVGRYLTYHANNSDYIGTRINRPAILISNSNAKKILEYLLGNPGVKIAQLSQALMMNRHTISYHIKRMQTSGLVERVERNGLRLSPIAEDHGERLTHLIASPAA